MSPIPFGGWKITPNLKYVQSNPDYYWGMGLTAEAVAREYKVRNAYDPKANINAGVQKLKALLEKWEGNISLALASYNAGEGAVSKFNGVPPYRETQKYVSTILSIAGIR